MSGGLLLDTNVISEARRRSRHAAFARWWSAVEEQDLYLSALTLGEIENGIAGVRTRDPLRVDALESWHGSVREAFGPRILPVDAEVAACWGRHAVGPTRPVIDGLIAATAIVHGLTLVTRNVRDFVGLAVEVHNPFE